MCPRDGISTVRNQRSRRSFQVNQLSLTTNKGLQACRAPRFILSRPTCPVAQSKLRAIKIRMLDIYTLNLIGKNYYWKESKNEDQNKTSPLLQEIGTCGACPWGADQEHADDFRHLDIFTKENICQNWQLNVNFCKPPVSIFPSIIPPAQGQFNTCTLYALGETETKKSGLWRQWGADWRKGDKFRETELCWGEAALSSKWGNWCDPHKSTCCPLFCHEHVHIGFFSNGDQK